MPDLNLLLTLDVLLTEESVARAAKRLRLSPSAMSRALARLRETMGDPLLVRAGRGLVPTPRAQELKARVGQLVEEVEAVLRPAEQLDLTRLVRTFTLRSSDGFVENFGVQLLARIRRVAPGVTLRFVQKLDKQSELLRHGLVDLETGVIGDLSGPEVRTRGLFRDHFIGVVRADHVLSQGDITPERYASGQHILVSRRGTETGPVDEALQVHGLSREIVTSVTGFSAAIALARGSDLIATVPARHTQSMCPDMFCFALPISVPEITISMLWHPRMDADPAHRWLRDQVLDVCGTR